MSNPISPPAVMNFETLNEPVSATIMRDLRMVGSKLKQVIKLTNNSNDQVNIQQSLHNWDLWGPLILCLILSISLSSSAPPNQTALVFAIVFVLVWCGAGIVTLNALLLGGTLSFLQSVCVLGYCLFPLTLASLVCHAYNEWIFQSIIVAIALLWSCRASLLFMQPLLQVSNTQYSNRRALAVYPLALFYATIGWMILVQE